MILIFMFYFVKLLNKNVFFSSKSTTLDRFVILTGNLLALSN
jgi:hypothetical protein